MLDRVGLGAHADKMPAELYGGEQQRAAIARALVNDPPVLVADEPTGNLDTHTGDAVLDLLSEVAAAGTCVLMVTHERDITRWVHRTVTLADKLPSTMSGGEQQRAAIARALANDPPVLVADEPTGNLDAATGDAVLDLLAGLAAAGTCVLMVTHERDIAERVPRTVTLADGRIARDTAAAPC
jgi:ABC-type lipoprotein export system ATPase subunit